jgi:hypothetical protein
VLTHQRRHRIFVLAALVLAACTPTSGSVDSDSQSESSQEVIVTRDADSGPLSCRPAAVGQVTVELLDAISTGSTDPSTLFASSFQWYSMTEGNPRKGGRHFVAYDLAKLERYFEGRHEQNEAMKLLELSVQYDPGRDLGHLILLIERTADDVKDVFGATAMGKGAVACGEGRVEVLSMAMSKSTATLMRPLCPESEEPLAGAAAVCSLN